MRKRLVFWACLYFSISNLAPAAIGGRQTLHNHVPAITATLPVLDRMSAEADLDLSIGLPLRNKEALTNLLEELYNPASTNYHHFLNAEEFAQRFGPTPEDYQKVRAFAELNGLTVTGTHSNRTLLNVHGPVATIEKTFHVTLREYRHPNEARTFHAPDVEPSIDLDVPVLTINGLNDFVLPHPAGRPGAGSVAPAGGTSPGGNYMGNDFRTAYAPGVTLTGTGQTVALLELDGYYTNDIASYRSLAGLPNVPITNVYIDNFTGTPSTGANSVGEVSLDIEMVISMAPGISKLMVYEAANCCFTWIDILNRIATDNIAKQISSSWLVGDNSSADQVYQQFAAHGQTYFQCSGDDGSFYTGIPQYADSPYLTTVGGTTLTTASSAVYGSERTWNNYFDGQGTNSSGGGVSHTYTIPSWQTNLVASTNGLSTTQRNSPDVSMVGDRVWVVYNNGASGWFWGTSCAAPLWAGYAALANQQAIAAGKTNIGFINPAIYALGARSNFTAYFHDVTTGNNTNATNPTNFFASAGYDLCTGWGTPTGSNLISALALGPDALQITTQPKNQIIPQGTNLTLSAVVNGGLPITYQWQLGGTNLTDDGHFFGSQSNVLAITNAQFSDAGNYRLIATNSFGSITSTVASITIYSLPVITGQPQNLNVPAGTNATFSVTAMGTPSPTYQWQIGGTNIAGAASSNYTITNVQITDQGTYSVTVANFYGSVTSSNATLTVQAPPIFTAEPPALQALNPGGFAHFTSTVSGSTPISYRWFFSHDTFTNASLIPAPTNSFYIIPSVTISDAGNYWVVVSNSFGSATSTVAVIQINQAPAITTQPQSATVFQGSNVVFSIAVTGSPSPVYQWYFNNSLLPGTFGSFLAITNAQTNNGGNYFVIASNSVGSVTSSVVTLTVTVPSPLRFQTIVALPNGQVQMTLTGQTGFNCAIDGSSNLSVWIQLTNFQNTNGTFQFSDTITTNSQQRFYRGRQLP